MAKYIFNENYSEKCFVAETFDAELISQLSNEIGQTKWVLGIIRLGTYNNTCGFTTHQWHYETFVGFSSVTIEECQVLISYIEQHLQEWTSRTSNTCIMGRLTNIVCDDLICDIAIE